MPRLEFHCHTRFSKDSLTDINRLLAVCREKGIERLAITDHNTIAGAMVARELDPVRVIVGEEIMTTEGELLVAYVEKAVPPGLTPEEAIARLRDQGAFISVSHPFDRTRKGHWQPESLERIAPLVDAIEVFNSRCFSPEPNHLAQAFAKQHRLAGTAGSDAHTTFEVGRSVMVLPAFHDATSLKDALAEARFETRMSSPLVHFTSRYAVWVKSTTRLLRATGLLILA
jgi:predicted metal-dependent phosphoesterase TrpH